MGSIDSKQLGADGAGAPPPWHGDEAGMIDNSQHAPATSRFSGPGRRDEADTDEEECYSRVLNSHAAALACAAARVGGDAEVPLPHDSQEPGPRPLAKRQLTEPPSPLQELQPQGTEPQQATEEPPGKKRRCAADAGSPHHDGDQAGSPAATAPAAAAQPQPALQQLQPLEAPAAPRAGMEAERQQQGPHQGAADPCSQAAGGSLAAEWPGAAGAAPAHQLPLSPLIERRRRQLAKRLTLAQLTAKYAQHRRAATAKAKAQQREQQPQQQPPAQEQPQEQSRQLQLAAAGTPQELEQLEPQQPLQEQLEQQQQPQHPQQSQQQERGGEVTPQEQQQLEPQGLAQMSGGSSPAGDRLGTEGVLHGGMRVLHLPATVLVSTSPRAGRDACAWR